MVCPHTLYHKRGGNRTGGTAPGPGTYHIVCAYDMKALGGLYHKCKGRIGGTAKREEAAPADSQFLQAQGHLASFVPTT